MQRRAASLIVFLLLVVGMAQLIGCSNSVKPPHKPPPLDPETELTYAPIENDTTTFRVRFYWNGYDRDGEVVRFYFAVDADSLKPIPQWHSTTANDTTFLLLVDPVTEIRGHVFMISAVDDKGAYDKTPARRYFSAKSIPPTSQIEKGPACFNPPVGPNFTFEWSGIDPDGGETGGKAPVDSFEYLLLLLGTVADKVTPPTHDPLPTYAEDYYVTLINQATGRTLPTRPRPDSHDDWAWVGIRGLRNRFRNATPGEYVFAERAVDLAGASEKNLKNCTNIRHFSVSTKNPGPSLIIFSSVFVTPLAPTSGPDDAPRKSLQIFEGETISFSWFATGVSYGGEVIGYTYALDDTSSFPGFDPLRTGVTFSPSQLAQGNHFLYVRTIDDGGLVTNAVIPIQIVHPSFRDPGAERTILYVDDSMAPGSTPTRVGSYPSDLEESDWWTLGLLPTVKIGGLPVPVTEWDTFQAGAANAEGRKPPEPKHLANYTTVIWNVDFNNGELTPTGLWKTLVGGSYSELSGYLRAGGTLILTGFTLSSNTCDPRTTLFSNLSRGICFTQAPGTPEYNLSYFPRVFMGVDGAISNGAGLRTLGARDFIAAYPTAAGIAAGYDTAQVDRGPLGSGAKWLTYPGTGELNSNSSPGLPQVDGWNMARNFGCEVQSAAVFRPEDPSRPIAQAIYTYHGARVGLYEEGGASPREGRVVGIQAQAHGLGTTAGAGTFNPNGSIGRTVHLGFPLYFLRDADAQRIIQTAFAYVNASPTLP